MTRQLTIFILALALSAGCTVSYRVSASAYVRPTAGIRVTTAPPPLRADVAQPAKPSDTAAWAPGHWDWQDGWEWVPGAWQEPRPGYAYEPPVCVEVHGGFDYYPGYYHPEAAEPPPVYRQPGTIQVHVTPAGTTPPVQRVAVQPNGGDATAQGADVTQGAGTVTVQTGSTEGGSGQTVDATSNGANVTAGTGSLSANANGANVTAGTGSLNANANGANVTQQAGTLPLACSLAVGTAPRGGLVTIRGQGFAQGLTVRIGGQLAVVEDVTPNMVSARMPGSSRGGAVSITLSGATAACGNVSLVGG